MGRRSTKNKVQSSGELPESFRERLSRIIPPSELSEVTRSFSERPPVFRVNTILGDEREVLSQLSSLGFEIQRVTWLPEAFCLAGRTKRELADTELYKSGKIYFQSLASMVPVLALDPQPGEAICDLTAAPGSKTSFIAARMKRQGTLLANEKSHARFFKLHHNMKQLGVVREGDSFCSLRKEDGARIAREYPGSFDRVLLDAPCSGEARFVVGDGESFGFWSTRKIDECVQPQRRLMLAALRLVKVGGLVVYSTCTMAPEENELILEYALKRSTREDGACAIAIEPWELSGLRVLPAVSTWGIREISEHAQRGIRIYPTVQVEPFFVARIRKLCELAQPFDRPSDGR